MKLVQCCCSQLLRMNGNSKNEMRRREKIRQAEIMKYAKRKLARNKEKDIYLMIELYLGLTFPGVDTPWTRA